ncbi:MAG: CPBP family intramembrane glutamic endopeptidase [Candidatus Kariarchaeaceae archaeon]|jgi:membrane protease YdiL (CAAX protease family)
MKKLYSPVFMVSGVFLFFNQNKRQSLLVKLIVFSLLSLLLIPYLITQHTVWDIWQLIETSKFAWIILIITAFLLIIPFLWKEELYIRGVKIHRVGIGELSYSSLILAPLFEEYLFRGIILGVSLTALQDHWAILLNGILFSLWHVPAIYVFPEGQLRQYLLLLLSTFIFGIVLAYFQFITSILLIPIVIHSLANVLVAITRFPPLPKDTRI